MSLKIIFGNSVQALGESLCGAINDSNADSLLPSPTRIIVPNTNLAKWLKITIAEKNGIAMNLEFPYLETALWDMVKALGGDDTKDCQPLDSDLLQRCIVAKLVQACKSEQKSRFATYCLGETHEGSKDEIPQDADSVRRISQLAERLARLFREYELHRGIYIANSGSRDMIGAWLKGETGLPEKDEEDKMWRVQRELYHSLFASDKSAMLPNHLSLPALARSVFPVNSSSENDLGTIHIFGMSQLSPFHCWLLYQLAKFADITLYHFNICREFWEDVQTPSESRWAKIKNASTKETDDGLELDLSIENKLLGTWGKAGREAVKLLADLDDGSGRCQVQWLDEENDSDDDSTETPGEKTSGSVLKAVQRGITYRTSELEQRCQDKSLQIAGCPGVYREAETVYNSILTNMHELKPEGMKLTDIAVLVPDMATYKPALLSVFQSGGEIPFNLSDSTADTDSVFGKGLLALLDLAGSKFTRRQVFSVLGNPCIMTALGISADDLDQWVEWAEELGIFHGFNKNHREEQGVPHEIINNRYTWEQGLQRLRLGRIMMTGTDDIASYEATDSWPQPYEGMKTRDRAADRFSLTVERLFHAVWHLGTESRKVADWVGTIEDLMNSFLGIPVDLAPEAYVRRKLRDALREWAGQTNKPGLTALWEATDTTLSLTWLRQFVADSLVAIPSGVGAYLTGGVTIASLLPMRPVPFKIVYVMGMTEGQFPGHADLSTLDLRNRRRMIGDVSPTDAGRYLFLETLMTVKEKLYLTYDAFDAKKDEEKFPCSVVQQLKTFLNQHVLKKPFEEVKIPLNSHDMKLLTGKANKPYTDLLEQWGFSERALGYLLASKKDEKLKGELEAKLEEVRAASPTSRRGKLASKALACHPAAASGESVSADSGEGSCATSEKIPDKVDIDIKDLVAFLKDPAKAILQKRFRLYDDDDTGEAEVAEDEPLQSDFLEDGGIRKQCLTEVFFSDANELEDAKQKLQDVLDQLLKERQLKSQGPDAAFGALEKKRLLEGMESQLKGLCSLRDENLSLVRNVVMGNAAPEDGDAGMTLDSVVLDVHLPDGGETQATISGLLEVGISFQEETQSLDGAVLIHGYKGQAKTFCAPLLQPLLFLMAVKAGPYASDTPWKVSLHSSFHENPKKLRKDDIILTSVACQNYFKGLIADYLTCQRQEALPFGLVVNNKIERSIVVGRAVSPHVSLEDVEGWVEEEKTKNLDPNEHPSWRLNDMEKVCWDDIQVPEGFNAICESRIVPLICAMDSSEEQTEGAE